MKKIKTLSQLADYINDCEDYPLDVEGICEANGWVACKEDYDIAIDKEHNEKLSFVGEGNKVDVTPYWGGARESAGRISLYKGEKKKMNLNLNTDAIALLTKAAKERGISRSDLVNEMIYSAFK